MTDSNLIVKSGPRETFLQLFSIITLYMSASSLIGLWFQYINLWFNTAAWPAEFFAMSIRFHLAVLIVSFPIYFYTLQKYRTWTAENPALNQLRIKNWLTYFTLFLATLCIVIDLATLIYRFLGGELSSSFLCKVVTLLVVCGLIFYYYQQDLKQAWATHTPRFFALAVGLIVLATIGYGFNITGSPFKARLANFDSQRLSDLSGIQIQVMNYWRDQHKLPANLEVLTDSINGYKAPTDPETKAAYSYKALSTNHFELCSVFNLASVNTDSTQPLLAINQGQVANWSWQHPAGEVCFKRTLNP